MKDALSHCQEPVHKVIFIKTHKTGSSTIATTVVRYADEKHLKLATPKYTHIFHQVKPFNHHMVLSFGDMGKFDMLASHARYDRKQMDMVVPKAKYITILRDPVRQLESAYSYYAMGKHIGIQADGNHELESFLKRPRYYFNDFEYHMKVQSWNGQIFDLGLDHTYHRNIEVVQDKIHSLDKELELVMIKEYFDESLLLLRKIFCWEWQDIVYISKGVRKQSLRQDISPELAAKIRQWNSADVQLYDHFNRTFWKKLHEYGPDLQKDLAYFRQLKRNVSTICVDVNSQSHYDKRVEAHTLKASAPPFCWRVMAQTMHYVNWVKFKYISYRVIIPFTIILAIFVALILFYRCYKNYRNSEYTYEKLHNISIIRLK